MKEFQIGDKVGYIHQSAEGIIEDVLYSNATDKFLYSVKWQGIGMPSRSQHNADELYPINDREYRYEISLHNNVVVAILYEKANDGEFEVARGHGHIIHDGVLGFTQAASYALKRIMLEINGGEMPMRGDHHDV